MKERHDIGKETGKDTGKETGKDTGQILLALLRNQQGEPLSGEKISQQLSISRTAVWKHIKKLQALGYDIEANTKTGYILTYEPAAIDVKAIKNNEQAYPYGHVVYAEQQVSSTQDLAKQLAEEGAAAGTLVIAEEQLGGKGRLGRQWYSPSGKGIWMSIVLRPHTPIQFAPQLTLLVAVALCHTFREYVKLDARIKWPNDIMLDGKKCSGILLESVAEEQRLKYVIAGIGIDVNISEADYEEALREVATSLRIASGKIIDRTALLQQFLTYLAQFMRLYEQQGFQPIARYWESYALGLGRKMNFQTAHKQFIATPIALSDYGAIIVRQDNGEEEMIYSAEMGEVRE